MVKGSCLCGGVKYEISGEMGEITHCHCTTCRKAHGAAFSSVSAVRLENFKVTAGEEILKFYESSPGKKRYFCPHCGAHIYAHRQTQQHIILRFGTLDDDPGVRPVNHIWMSMKPPWYEIETDCKLPRFAEWPDDRQS